MIYDTRHNIFAALINALATVITLVMLGTVLAATAGAQVAHPNRQSVSKEQPLYSEYRGVQIGMKAQDVRTKLGQPAQKVDNLEMYAFPESETAQIAYDALQNVRVISVDFAGGIGAPDYKLIVGPDVSINEDGGIYKLVRYESLGLWVSYNRTSGQTPLVSITISKL